LRHAPAIGTIRPDRRSSSESESNVGAIAMLRWTLTFFVVAIIAAVLGFAGTAGSAAAIAQVLFFLFLVALVVSLVMHLARG
jgi:uncharacterized membrane protein YtjA (UPF0391 family)